MKEFIIILIPLLLCSCRHSTSDDGSTTGIFAIYLLRDSTISAGDAFARAIDSLELAPTAFLTANDLRSYTWATHAFEMTDQAQARFEQYLQSHGTTWGLPFVTTVGTEKIYLGTFWWAYSSSMPPACAVIEALSPLPYTIRLTNGAVDKRNDQRIYASLKRSGVLIE